MEIDVIIEKAKLIKEVDNPDGIDNLIKSLESYKANKGDIRKKRLYSFLFGKSDTRFPQDGRWVTVKAPLYGLTTKVVEKLEKYYNDWICQFRKKDKYLASYVIDTDDEIYDYVFDVEFYPVSHKLEILLYKHDFDIFGDFNVKCNMYYDSPIDSRKLIDFDKINSESNA